jgi:hypothetical protein
MGHIEVGRCGGPPSFPHPIPKAQDFCSGHLPVPHGHCHLQVLEAVDAVAPHHPMRDALITLLTTHASVRCNTASAAVRGVARASSNLSKSSFERDRTFLETSVTAMTVFSLARGIARGERGRNGRFHSGPLSRTLGRPSISRPAGVRYYRYSWPNCIFLRLAGQGSVRIVRTPGVRGTGGPNSGRLPGEWCVKV